MRRRPGKTLVRFGKVRDLLFKLLKLRSFNYVFWLCLKESITVVRKHFFALKVFIHFREVALIPGKVLVLGCCC